MEIAGRSDVGMGFQTWAIEMYDKRGRTHQGEYDPNTGAQTKPPDKTRSTEN